MNHCNDIDLVGLDVIDDPVWTTEYLSYLIDIVFQHPTAGQRECRDLLGSLDDVIHCTQRIAFRILRDVGVDRIKMSLCRFRPVDFHSGNPYFLLVSDTSLVLPDALSSKPFSMAART
jgi:predicted amidohydrolase